MTEDQLEQETIQWLADIGWQHCYGPELAPDGSAPERDSYLQVLLLTRLRRAIAVLNPSVPDAAREDAIRQVLDLGTPVLLAVNRQFHRLLVAGVPVQYQRDGETVGDFVRLIDWREPGRNEWLAVNQFSITGPHHTRRPDIVLFVNGLPLILIELKNPADPNADVWKAFQQIETYKAQIADVFQYNEVLVVSDGTDAPMDKPNIGILDDAFLAEVRNLPERNLAVELLERLLEGEIKSRFASNVVQSKKFSDMLTDVLQRYQNRSIEAAQVMEALVEMAKKFREAASRGEQLGLTEDEVRFYDALATNASAVREMSDETLKRIAHELTQGLRANLTVDWSERESVQAKLRLMVKPILRTYRYPPDQQESTIELVLLQTRALGEAY